MMKNPVQVLAWLGVIGVAGVAVSELPYVNWRRIVPPVDTRPLVIRQDAKGDGRFLSPRSGRRRHRGLDLIADLKSPVYAIRSGRVVKVAMHHGLGRYVELEHGGGLHSLYAHLSSSTVRPGRRVRQGDVIGTVGKTGNARSWWITPHLHLELVSARGELVDPRSLGLDVIEPPPSPDIAHAIGGN